MFYAVSTHEFFYTIGLRSNGLHPSSTSSLHRSHIIIFSMEGQKDRVSDTRGPRGEVAPPHWFVQRGLGYGIECHRERVGRRRPHSHPLGQRSEKEKERERG